MSYSAFLFSLMLLLFFFNILIYSDLRFAPLLVFHSILKCRNVDIVEEIPSYFPFLFSILKSLVRVWSVLCFNVMYLYLIIISWWYDLKYLLVLYHKLIFLYQRSINIVGLPSKLNNFSTSYRYISTITESLFGKPMSP